MKFAVAITPGELLDRISILQLRCEHAPMEAKPALWVELDTLQVMRNTRLPLTEELLALEKELAEYNRTVWNAEDALRGFERAGDFGAMFVVAARTAYLHNDGRTRVKAEINRLLHCPEETKIYQ